MKMQDAMAHLHSGVGKVQAVGQATIHGAKIGWEFILGLAVIVLVGGFFLIPFGHNAFSYWGESSLVKAWTSPSKASVAGRR